MGFGSGESKTGEVDGEYGREATDWRTVLSERVSVKEYCRSGGSGLSVITMEGGLDVWVEALMGKGFDVWVEAQQIQGEGKENKSVRRVAKCCDCLSAAIGAR